MGIKKEIPNIKISYNPNVAGTEKSFGKYTPVLRDVVVVGVNRNLADILRTLAHELVHIMQYEDGVLTSNSNDSGSEDENHANAMAGTLMRKFGKEYPEIFE